MIRVLLYGLGPIGAYVGRQAGDARWFRIVGLSTSIPQK